MINKTIGNDYGEFSPEQMEHLRETAQKLSQILNDLWDAVVEMCKIVMQKIREVTESLARFFLKMQLLEWRIPYPLADWFSQKANSWLAYKIGGHWLETALLE